MGLRAACVSVYVCMNACVGGGRRHDRLRQQACWGRVTLQGDMQRPLGPPGRLPRVLTPLAHGRRPPPHGVCVCVCRYLLTSPQPGRAPPPAAPQPPGLQQLPAALEDRLQEVIRARGAPPLPLPLPQSQLEAAAAAAAAAAGTRKGGRRPRLKEAQARAAAEGRGHLPAYRHACDLRVPEPGAWWSGAEGVETELLKVVDYAGCVVSAGARGGLGGGPAGSPRFPVSPCNGSNVGVRSPLEAREAPAGILDGGYRSHGLGPPLHSS